MRQYRAATGGRCAIGEADVIRIDERSWRSWPGAMKAPRIAACADTMAKRALDKGWTTSPISLRFAEEAPPGTPMAVNTV